MTAAPSLLRRHGGGVSLVIDPRGAGRVLYWGPALPAITDGLWNAEPPATPDPGGAAPLVPLTGWGYGGLPALSGRWAGGGWAPRLAVTAVSGEGQALSLTLADPGGALSVVLDWELDADTGVLTGTAAVTNHGAEPYRLDGCAALCLPLPGWVDEALTFEGGYIREFQEHRQPIGPGALVRENRRGRTSHDSFPALVAGEAGFGAVHGSLFAVHLGWSGNHRLTLETLAAGTRVLMAGELLLPGEVVLAPGETYRTPPAYAVAADGGLNGLMARTHAHVRRRILPRVPLPERPVHLNTWEAVYHAHDPQGLGDLARAAAAVGVERFVLDDGWFHGRVNERHGLGDWWPDPSKHPGGLAPLAEAVRALGMRFALWVEPETVNPGSTLHTDHPDWLLRLPGDPDGRRQYVLDLGREAVADHLFARIDALLRSAPVDMLKWDMNRDLAGTGWQGEPAVRRQVAGVYRLIDRLRATHPHLEIESCASGGGRADWGILARCERIWVSDSMDAHDRLSMQRGFTLFFPPEVMGAHVGRGQSAVTGRRLELDFRCAVALFGHMGVEWDLRGINAEERDRLAAWIALHKRHRALLHGGRWVRLPLDDRAVTGHGVVAGDGGSALYLVAQQVTRPGIVTVRLPGLAPGAVYRVTVPEPSPCPLPWGRAGLRFTGAHLAAAGLRLPLGTPDEAVVLHLERCGGETS
ncbi:alpha-galactosidase [Azospirillum fermentarium]|uniref:alpha-galactosidase n=1 Tax=Azospirillum fermentarium TaxID=1233114 RepID=UPI002227E257|nr:alpha-galactosidase [Azospirillum fermentarium]MCW2247871.1 alpha-galactosidase [Azospirillum fermentarium]